MATFTYDEPFAYLSTVDCNTRLHDQVRYNDNYNFASGLDLNTQIVSEPQGNEKILDFFLLFSYLVLNAIQEFNMQIKRLRCVCLSCFVCVANYQIIIRFYISAIIIDERDSSPAMDRVDRKICQLIMEY